MQKYQCGMRWLSGVDYFSRFVKDFLCYFFQKQTSKDHVTKGNLQSSIGFDRPGILSENLKTLTSSNYSSIFFAETSHTFSTYQCLQKRVWDFFYFIKILSYLKKLKKTWFLHTRFYTFINNSRSKQNKKNPAHPYVDITKQKTCAEFQQKIWNPMIVGARQSFQFFRQKTYFIGNNRCLP